MHFILQFDSFWLEKIHPSTCGSVIFRILSVGLQNARTDFLTNVAVDVIMQKSHVFIVCLKSFTMPTSSIQNGSSEHAEKNPFHPILHTPNPRWRERGMRMPQPHFPAPANQTWIMWAGISFSEVCTKETVTRKLACQTLKICCCQPFGRWLVLIDIYDISRNMNNDTPWSVARLNQLPSDH